MVFVDSDMCSLLISNMAVNCGYVSNFDSASWTATSDAYLVDNLRRRAVNSTGHCTGTQNYNSPAPKNNQTNQNLMRQTSSVLPDLVRSHMHLPDSSPVEMAEELPSSTSWLRRRSQLSRKRNVNKTRLSNSTCDDSLRRIPSVEDRSDEEVSLRTHYCECHRTRATILREQKNYAKVGKEIRKIADDFGNNYKKNSPIIKQEDVESFQNFMTKFIVFSCLGILAFKHFRRS